jgi:GntR family transcriptional regulator
VPLVISSSSRVSESPIFTAIRLSFKISSASTSADPLDTCIAQLGRLRADAAASRLLRLPAGASVFLIRRLLLLAGTKICYEEVRLPAARYKGLSTAVIEEHECMLYSLYETRFGVRIVHADEQLKAVTAPREAAAALALPAGAPVLQIERVAYTYAEDPAELRRSWNDTRSHHYRNRTMG